MINNEEATCKPTVSLVKNDNGDALDGGLENLILVNEDGNVEVNEASYDGTESSLRLKVIHPSGSPVTKVIKISDRCAGNPISYKDNEDIEIQAVKNGDQKQMSS